MSDLPAPPSPRLPPSHGLLAGDSDDSSELDRFVAALAADAAATERTRQRWLEQQAAESATLTGLLVELGEVGAPFVISLIGGRRLSVRVTAVGADVVACEQREGQRLLVRCSAIAAVRPSARRRHLGDRHHASTVNFEDAIGLAAADRPDAQLLDAAGDPSLSGRLMSASGDLLVVRLDGEGSGHVHVPLHAVGGVSLA